MAVNPFFWDKRLGRYRLANGQLVSDIAIRQELDRIHARHGLEMQQLAEQQRRGLLSDAQWHLSMREAIKDVQSYSAALARGGWSEMTPSAWGSVGAEVRKQYAYLDRFLGELHSGDQAKDGSMLTRADLYAHAGLSSFYRATSAEKQLRGFTEAKNIEQPGAQHCEDCPALSAQGWTPIAQMPPPGQRKCGSKCKCRLAYR